jgi:signal transduction histidine kinase
MQVMNNLLSNALKFSHEGGTVWVRVEPTGRPRPDLVSRMKESGIPNNAHDRVFGKFSQVD